MRISTKGRYALRFMLDLAENSNGKPVNIRYIAERQGVSKKYLENIVAVLNHGGYVKSVRGAQGGYALTKRPDEYTVGMILRLSEGSLAPVSCIENDTLCDRFDQCSTARLWTMIDDAVKGVVDKVTLADMLKWQHDSN